MSSDSPELYKQETVHRTHDKFYLTEHRKNNPKEYFKFIANIAEPLMQSKNMKVIDVGCATGDFVFYLRHRFPEISLTGMDIDSELLTRAREEVEGVNFLQGDITKNCLSEKYDIIFQNGVHSIFDDFEWLNNLLNSMTDSGRLFIFGLFNPEDLDVLIKSRPAASEGKWETGWNLYSKKSVLHFIESKGFNGVYRDFEIGLDLEKKPSDPLRSWTERLEDGRRIIINGLQLVNTLSLLEIKKG